MSGGAPAPVAGITVTDTAGAARTIAGEPGDTLMEAMTRVGFDDLLAICGGSCSCATCHVYIDDAVAFAALPAAGDGEEALLDDAEQRRPTSRLSCQIRLADAPAAFSVTIAPGG